MKTTIPTPKLPETVPETELGRDKYAAALAAMENACKYVISVDEANAGQFVDQSLRYLRFVRAEIKRTTKIREATK